MPALVVGHGEDGDWYVGDGVSDPNLPGACIATHLAHVTSADAAVGELGSLPPGHEATRSGPGERWTIERVTRN